MKPVMQTRFGDEGNCLQAAIASLMELPLDGVPDFVERDWWGTLQRWLHPMGLYPIIVRAGSGGRVPSSVGYYLISGKSPRGWDHMVVAKEGEVAHDPHPDGSGLLEVEEILLFARIFE